MHGFAEAALFFISHDQRDVESFGFLVCRYQCGVESFGLLFQLPAELLSYSGSPIEFVESVEYWPLLFQFAF